MSAVESFINYKATTGMQCGSYSIDLPPLKENEQYRFHFDATKCIGCHCCEVACNEQNNNPAEVKWRRVGEVEGGEFPNVLQMFLSMSCNHCIDPACLKGCPTNSYIKIDNGIVIHDDEACIGCQYCTWNCPYDVPVFDTKRHIVTKCHMCYERIEVNQTPSCVQACPEGAIEIEVVNIDEWLDGKIDQEANAPGLIDARVTGSTTRFTLPENLPEKLEPMDKDLIKPANKEWPLVFMTVFTQISLIGFGAIFLGDLGSKFTALPSPSFTMAFVVFMLSAIGLPLSALHLGRPFKALSAMKNIKTSWLSKEAAALGVFAEGIGIVALLYYFHIDGFFRLFLEALILGIGIYGIYAQSMIYRIPAKPTWNTVLTTYTFFTTGYIATTLLALMAIIQGWSEVANILLVFTILLGAMHLYLFLESQKLYEKNNYQIQKAKKLLQSSFANLYRFRKASLPIAALLLPLLSIIALNAGSIGFAFLFVLSAVLLGFASEIVGRLLFYTTAIKTGMPGNFFAGAQRP
ncbi:DmsC/YnfH family molybdoenzyme membrane anchor subunit [Nitratiruptor sp. YY09-18]|uniref:DmsC/YnfH family molybdoenzyme membrane anchor subunit n=1 Tax=Nitratiruptor sp. YY09-18 TaxID=2724901 RepID=UPI0019169956|nr:DmsC/YnfH family molybdoenzyme membrane anchor subunit [Nitratiruptor sp. YY09-18]BCD68542.1 molybdopterin oxidoreductase, iron sulfur subunit [Nitratiruptor sp. YY09-18]